MRAAVDRVLALASDGGSHHVAFVNAFCANVAYEDAEYRDVLAAADVVFPDGVGVAIAARMLGRRISENVNGTDMFPALLGALRGTGLRLFLLGAAPGVAERVADWIRSAYPGVEVAGCRHGYFAQEEEPTVVRAIADARTDLLLVGFGVPKQETWIRRNLRATGAKVAIGVGGLFDFYSGRIPRAPRWVRAASMEWAFRLVQEPRRLWRRYLIGNPLFLYRVARQCLALAPDPPHASPTPPAPGPKTPP
jgi:N-acetylglucosaminyldiphosphoundecaprenol N-acetyl-beta-D-mannosaminyltransferase